MLGSSLRCFSSRRCISRELCLPLFAARFPRPLTRCFASRPEFPVEQEYSSPREAAGSRKDRRLAESRISRPGLSSTSVLEGGFTRSHDHEAETDKVEVEQDLRDEGSLRATFYSIIQDGQPDNVLNALLDPRFEDLVGSLPHTVFVEVFNLLSPAYFIEPYREIHRRIHPAAAEVKKIKLLDSIFDEFVNNLATVVNIRQSAGHVLGLAEYTHLLDCARSIGDATMAESVWHNMKEDDIFPDVRCYNYYMEAKVWDNAYTGKERYNLRMTPYAYRKRKFFRPNDGWRGYGTAGRSVRKEVLQIFNEMTEQGEHSDESTYINVFLASSRVGHVRGMKNVLQVAWNVDIDALLNDVDESNLPQVTYYDPSSPLYPSERLLFAIAHGFGTNNDIVAALKAVEFISRSYDLAVPEKVWFELFERAFVLSRPRFGPDAERNAKGRISYDFLIEMYETMISEPFNIRPTIEIYHMLAKTAWTRCRLREFNQHMCAAYELLEQTRGQRQIARSVVEGYLGNPLSKSSRERMESMNPQILQSRAFAEAMNTYDILRLRTAQHTYIMERLARLMLIHNRWVGRDNPDWQRCLLPQALHEWKDFLPLSFSYRTNGGLVEFHGATEWRQKYTTDHDRVPVRRSLYNESDPEFAPESRELDDDFFWERYRQECPELDFDAAPLNRLFWEYEGEVSEATLRYWAEDTDIQSDTVQHDSDGRQLSGPNKKREEQNDAVYGDIPGHFTMA